MPIQLSKRENSILLHLLTNTGVMQIKELAEQFSLSVRTIKYDLDTIRLWLGEREYELRSKRGKGIWLDLTDFQKLSLKNEILQLEKLEDNVDQEVRIYKLVFELLNQGKYISSDRLSEKLGVSKNTITSDLEKVEEFMLKNDLILIKQPRKGIKVVGEEGNIRLALEQIIQIELSEYDIYNIMNKLVKSDSYERAFKLYIGSNREFQVTYGETLNSMTELIDGDIFEQLNYSEILSITIRTAISVTRLVRQKTIGRYKLLADQQGLLRKKELPYLLVQAIYEKYELPILEDEYHYIYSDVFENEQNQDIANMAEQIITHVARKLSCPFDRDEVLFTNLFAHLSLRLARKHLFINEYNPFVVDIKAKYPALYTAIKEGSLRAISGSALIVNDSFIAYLALHFLVSVEKFRTKDSVKVVYVCSTGLGVTSLIQQKISEEINGLEIVSFASILNLREVVKSCLPDLIITIFPIEESDTTWIKVSPIPTSEDLKKIQLLVDGLLSNGLQSGSKVSLKLRHKSQSSLTTEEESRELIVKGFIIFESLKEILSERIDHELMDSFLLHVFLMVHRIVYKAQYQQMSIDSKQIIGEHQGIVAEIESVFAINQLPVNESEILALLHYLKKEVSLRMSLSEDAKNIVNESQYQEKLKAIMMSAEKLLNKAGIEPTEIQWTILINHLNEMIRRSTEQEKLPEIDVKLFDEVSEVSLELAEVIVNEIANLSVDEKYVLSIHFETAKNN